MMIGHLPAGYLTTRLLTDPRSARGLFVAGLAGSVAPDLDMLWFIASGGHTHHHAWPTHFPLVWVAALSLSLLAGSRYAALFSLEGLLHQLLDSLVGDIAWLAPFDMHRRSLFVVTDRFDPWWLNFVLHWTFGLEIALVVLALLCWRADRAPAHFGGNSQR